MRERNHIHLLSEMFHELLCFLISFLYLYEFVLISDFAIIVEDEQ